MSGETVVVLGGGIGGIVAANALRARLAIGAVPEICVLDPDGDFARHLKGSGSPRNPYWTCYHTELCFAQAKDCPIVCLAHVTHQMALVENDFEEGEAAGNTAVVRLISVLAQAWRARA